MNSALVPRELEQLGPHYRRKVQKYDSFSIGRLPVRKVSQQFS